MSNKGKGINIWSLKRSIPRGVLRKGILKICSKFTGDTKTANENILFLKFSIKGFFSKCDKIRRKRRIWSHLLKKSLKNFIFCAVVVPLLSKKNSKSDKVVKTVSYKKEVNWTLRTYFANIISYLQILNIHEVEFNLRSNRRHWPIKNSTVQSHSNFVNIEH